MKVVLLEKTVSGRLNWCLTSKTLPRTLKTPYSRRLRYLEDIKNATKLGN